MSFGEFRARSRRQYCSFGQSRIPNTASKGLAGAAADGRHDWSIVSRAYLNRCAGQRDRRTVHSRSVAILDCGNLGAGDRMHDLDPRRHPIAPHQAISGSMPSAVSRDRTVKSLVPTNRSRMTGSPLARRRASLRRSGCTSRPHRAGSRASSAEGAVSAAGRRRPARRS